jgi:hypothetical protein
MAERSLSMREAPGSIPGLSRACCDMIGTYDLLQKITLSCDMKCAHEQLFLPSWKVFSKLVIGEAGLMEIYLFHLVVSYMLLLIKA